MAKSRAQKNALLETYKELLERSSGFFAVNTEGMNAEVVTKLKKKLKTEANSNVYVVKNSVFKMALEDAGYPVEASTFTEQTAIIGYGEDPTIVAKLIKDVQKESEKLDAKFGVFQGKYTDAERAMALAEIPPREVLLAKLLGSMQAPLSGFASVSTGNARGFVRVLQELSEGKGTKAEG